MASQSKTFELAELINRHSLENDSDTPDYLLSKFMIGCLYNYQMAVRARDKWFNVNMWEKHNPDGLLP
jgi:hypothetical protein